MLIGIDGNEANIEKRVGANVYAYELLCNLHKRIRQLADQGSKQNLSFKIYLKSNPISDLPLENENWKYKTFGPGKLWTQWRLPLELYREKVVGKAPDVFFTPGHYAPRQAPMPTVVSIMDLAYLQFPQDFKEKDLYQLKTWTRYSVKNAKQILTISEATKKDIVKFYQIAPQNITVTYPGYDRQRFRIYDLRFKKLSRSKARRKYGVADQYLIYVGTLQPRKNLVRLIAAFARIKTEFPQLKLVIVGKKGWLYEEIFATVQRLGLGESVIFTGFVTDEILPELLANAQALILPSLYEGFGIPVVEAMACGVPVVVSRVSSLPEIAGEAGVYIENPTSVSSISAALAQVLKLSQNQKNKLIERANIKVEKFSWQRCAAQTLDILQKSASVFKGGRHV